MLVLSRKKSQQVVFPHLGIKVEILRVSGNTVSLGVEAPKSVQILRGELSASESMGDLCASAAGRPILHQIRNQLHRAQMIVSLAQKQLDSGRLEDPENILQDMLCRLNELDKETTGHSPAPNVEAHSPTSDAAAGKHALLVEDDANERTLLAAYLRLCGFKVTEASDGAEAMEILAQQAVDLVVLDMHMPRMNGLETLQAMRSQPTLKHTKVVIVSGEDRDNVVGAEVADKADFVSQWFSKPLNPVHLVDHLQAALN